jgi:hypothetical protein
MVVALEKDESFESARIAANERRRKRDRRVEEREEEAGQKCGE